MTSISPVAVTHAGSEEEDYWQKMMESKQNRKSGRSFRGGKRGGSCDVVGGKRGGSCDVVGGEDR